MKSRARHWVELSFGDGVASVESRTARTAEEKIQRGLARLGGQVSRRNGRSRSESVREVAAQKGLNQVCLCWPDIGDGVEPALTGEHGRRGVAGHHLYGFLDCVVEVGVLGRIQLGVGDVMTLTDVLVH